MIWRKTEVNSLPSAANYTVQILLIHPQPILSSP